MHRIAPTETDTASATLETCLWGAADARTSEQKQIQNLRRTRDLLLPRLLSVQVALNGKET